MRHDVIDLDCPTSVAAGAAKTIREHQLGSVHIYGSGSWTAQLQGKIGTGSVWTNIGAAGTNAAAVIVAVPDGVTDLRINVTAFASGTAVAQYGGFFTRGE